MEIDIPPRETLSVSKVAGMREVRYDTVAVSFKKAVRQDYVDARRGK